MLYISCNLLNICIHKTMAKQHIVEYQPSSLVIKCLLQSCDLLLLSSIRKVRDHISSSQKKKTKIWHSKWSFSWLSIPFMLLESQEIVNWTIVGQHLSVAFLWVMIIFRCCSKFKGILHWRLGIFGFKSSTVIHSKAQIQVLNN